ncbi:Eco57I restriction-modification methylase domain-containing protein [Lactococcus formosensis]|uniref:Eco57I restriction-modification methylase domain-containing protein n=1 Tax=Lactococcus formosensis TaxID=1281486 RepID=A0A9X4P0D0_9LACT|nr:Eco57I restriction-modification methylase domain-containing protein [Lactococcus formosensis]MDG6133607.1 Eco57I restriction-modification methylase domain-containing protein [Lactococcus formosensis]MDG6135604.1 Eco57I restriction-modification methylase domain-containing protein [Lactococcus formosensis]MDG6141710.1 Eco57I restriction-modification methylase domain-containing protein [Lactococcus formosensis]MDG6146221.1 Eco57I restriction-modification methylase domain-containing protein [Lac
MSNFEFLTLELETAELFQTANFAEKNYTEKDYEGTLTKVRKLAENTANEIAIKEHIVLSERSNFNDVLRELKNDSINQFIIESFYEIKRLGNDSAHNINSRSATQENAKQALHKIFIILVWYMNHYFEIDIKTAYLDFLEPQAEKLYQTAERKLIYIQTADNTSGMFPAYKDAQKIGEATAPDDDFEVDWSPNSEFLRTVGAKRINQYMKTSGIKFVLEWVELAWKKSTKTWFHDHDVHEVLKRSGIKRPEFLDGSEWFETDVETAKSAIKAVKEGQSALDSVGSTNADDHITLRPEQSLAVEKTRKNFKKNKKMLWNAKMRFGKTLTSLELIKEQKYTKVLIMTHRPVVSDSWFEDFVKMKMAEEGYRYGSEDTQFKLKDLKSGNTPFIYFVSIQKLRYGGGKVNLREFTDVDWDLIIIDEAHEGTQTELADNVLKSLEKDNTKILSLSGTPFNIQDQYSEESVYTWDYTMEQSAKLRYSLEHPTEKNPYESLPKVNMFTFEMKNKERFSDNSKSFNFREFFRVNENNEFVHKHDINAFLDNITNQDSSTNYPFSTKQYRNELRHTLWLLPGVKEANAFEKLLNEHQIFGKEYKIVNVVKDDKSDINEVATEGDLDKVRQAIGDPSQSKTITLTVRKLTTGVNIPEWTAVLFLSNTNSAMNYLQAAFRAQTPFSHEKLGMKKNCYIFDFAPDRALTVMAESAQINSGVGKKNTLQQKEAMTQLLNFMPILGQTEHGMKVFNVDRMLTQLKKVYAEKAVRSGFEDDSLYNDELLTLDEADLNDFNNLKEIVGKTNLSGLPKKVEINVNGLTDEEYEKGEKAQKKKPRERTTEEKEIIEKVKQAKKQRKTMISILRGISIRIPMMIYGMPIEVDKEMGIDEFVNHVDSISWEEFMPKGIKKSDFKRFAKYYDPEVFVEAGRIIRQRAQSYDCLEYTERAEKIAELFGTFKNPDKETVLTPWRVVNLQLSKTIGGLRYFDENFENTTLNGQDSITWVDTDITKEVFKSDTKILEINSKTGLYPLYVASSLFYQNRNKLNDDRAGRFSKIDEDEIIQEVLKDNIYVIAKTPMAKTITQRTLAGYNDWTTNILYVKEINQKLKSNMDRTIEEIQKGLNVMKFDVVVGNPPYQEAGVKDGSRDEPVYHEFIKLAYEISDKSVLITPGRFLFNAGQTPKSWNEKMLADEHLKVVHYEQNSSKIFPNTDIKGGIVVTYHDKNKIFGAIDTFTHFSELNSILGKVVTDNFESFNELLYGKSSYKLTSKIYEDFPILKGRVSIGEEKSIGSNIFDKLPEIFFSNQQNDRQIRILGRENNNRVYKWMDKSYLMDHPNFEKYKVILPASNGSGALGETLSTPLVGEPLVGYTQTFISFGSFNDVSEVQNVLKYVKSKFMRVMLGTMKITQHNQSKEVWKNVPLQDFSSNSDIDWTKSIPEIDQQLYKKYGLNQEEINFVEEKVKPME